MGREFRAFAVKSAVFGSAIWVVAALFVKWTRRVFFDSNAPLLYTLLLFAASIPVSFAIVQTARVALGSLTKPNVLFSIVIATTVAGMLDGAAMVLLPDALYGGAGDGLAKGAAWILWGVGWCLFWTINEECFETNALRVK
ncbi:hypothetical protein DYB32_007141 [Aphanomyces invadans]|uniref:Uncharacterized protein n=1 Tax=Aphanomyces invadans TaxID=157072 RepID=A0A418APX5_9STRA|nr:hypothetical protein DYB32_007141 [Aphanomyces invadans]